RYLYVIGSNRRAADLVGIMAPPPTRQPTLDRDRQPPAGRVNPHEAHPAHPHSKAPSLRFERPDPLNHRRPGTPQQTGQK
ncbi:hypothetical protein, partial [Streptomyces ureilyticus]|uniref:hypothetical protein n=1 Tax=Streptomyces ureilyticus TaxID=1775131 RepID=UPI0019D15144